MENEKDLVVVTVLKSAPLHVKGPHKLIYPDGKQEIREDSHLCRCGGSANKPFCDGSHRKLEFDK
ncbi:MAG: CDGSH iron-sulfur domain-containing protein [Bacteroidia bacterium]|nr:CDGSH iron-sulfur domain-containing protein [Bacteroidia bacterium]